MNGRFRAPRGGEDKCNTSRVKRRVPPRFINKHKGMRAEHRVHIASLLPQPGGQAHTAVALPPSRRQAGQAMCAFPRDRQGRQKAMCAPCPRPACLRPAQSGFKVGKKRAGGWVILGQNIALFYKKAARSAGRADGGERFRKLCAKESPGRCPATPTRKLSSFYPKAQQLLPKSSAAPTPKLLRVWGMGSRGRTHGQPRVWGTMCGEDGVRTAEDMGYRLPSFLAGAAEVAGTAC